MYQMRKYDPFKAQKANFELKIRPKIGPENLTGTENVNKTGNRKNDSLTKKI